MYFPSGDQVGAESFVPSVSARLPGPSEDTVMRPSAVAW
jgi:hypothetical protein